LGLLSLTNWYYIYIVITLGSILYFIRRFAKLRPVVASVDRDGLAEYLKKNPLIVDVRSDREWQLDAWQAYHLSYDLIGSLQVDSASEILLVCNSGIRSSEAAITLTQKGFSKATFYNGYYKDVIKALSKTP